MDKSGQVINGIKRFNRDTFGGLPVEGLVIPITQYLRGERGPLCERHVFRIIHE